MVLSTVLYYAMQGGREMNVSMENLASYVALVCHWLLVEGVFTQMEAVREGFNSVFPITSLGRCFYPRLDGVIGWPVGGLSCHASTVLRCTVMFYPDELDQIICGTVQSYVSWEPRGLA